MLTFVDTENRPLEAEIRYENTLRESKEKIYLYTQDYRYHPDITRFFIVRNEQRVDIAPSKLVNGRYISNDFLKLYRVFPDLAPVKVIVESAIDDPNSKHKKNYMGLPKEELQKQFPFFNEMLQKTIHKKPVYETRHIEDVLRKERAFENTLSYKPYEIQTNFEAYKSEYRVIPQEKVHVDLQKLFDLYILTPEFLMARVWIDVNEYATKVHYDIDKKYIAPWILNERQTDVKHVKGFSARVLLNGKVTTFTVSEDGVIRVECTEKMTCRNVLAKFINKIREYKLAFITGEISPFAYDHMEAVSIAAKLQTTYNVNSRNILSGNEYEDYFVPDGDFRYRFIRENEPVEIQQRNKESIDLEDFEINIERLTGPLITVSVPKENKRGNLSSMHGISFDLKGGKSLSHIRMIFDYFLRFLFSHVPGRINLTTKEDMLQSMTKIKRLSELGVRMTEGYSRDCQKKRQPSTTFGTPVSEHGEFLPSVRFRNRNNDSFNMYCDTEAYPRLGITQKGNYCCFGKDEKSPELEKYYTDDPSVYIHVDEQLEKEKRQSTNRITTGKALNANQIGALPDNLQKVFTLLPDEYEYYRIGVPTGTFWACFEKLAKFDIRETVIDYAVDYYYTLKISKDMSKVDGIRYMESANAPYYIFVEAVSKFLHASIIIFSSRNGNIICNASYHNDSKKAVFLYRHEELDRFELIIKETTNGHHIFTFRSTDKAFTAVTELYDYSCRQPIADFTYINDPVEQKTVNELMEKFEFKKQMINNFSEVLYLITPYSELIPVKMGYMGTEKIPTVSMWNRKQNHSNLEKYLESVDQTFLYLKEYAQKEPSLMPLLQVVSEGKAVAIITVSGLAVPTLVSEIRSSLPVSTMNYMTDIDNAIFTQTKRMDRRIEILTSKKIKFFTIGQMKTELARHFTVYEPEIVPEVLHHIKSTRKTKTEKKAYLVNLIQEILGQRIGSPRFQHRNAENDYMLEEYAVPNVVCLDKDVADACKATVGCGWQAGSSLSGGGVCRFETPNNDQFTEYVYQTAEDILADQDHDLLKGRLDLNQQSSSQRIFYIRPDEVLLYDIDEVKNFIGE